MSRTLLTAPTTWSTLSPGANVRNDLWTLLQQTYDLGGQPLTIPLAGGVFTDAFNGAGELVGCTSINQIQFVGSSDPAHPTIIKPNAVTGAQGYCWEGQAGARYGFQNCFNDGTNSQTDLIAVTEPGSAIVVGGGNTFGPAPGFIDMQAGSFGRIYLPSPYTIDKTGAACASQCHVQGDPFSYVLVEPASLTITIAGSPAYSEAFALSNSAFLGLAGLNFTAPFSGVPFWSYGGGAILTGATGPYNGTTLNPGYFPSSDKVITGTITTTAGSTAATTSVAIGGLLSQPGLVIVAGDGGDPTPFPDGLNLVNPGCASGTAVTLVYPALHSGTYNFRAGGFCYGGGQYLGSATYMRYPPP